LKRPITVFAQALSFVLLCSPSASAAIVTGFTASFAPNAEYSFSSLQTKFSGSTATVTNTSLTCLSEVSCSGQILNFFIQGTGLAPTQLIAVTLDGNLSGTTGATGALLISALGPASTFSFKAGDFNTTLLNTFVPITGNFAFTGALALNLASGQTLTLPSSLAISIGSSAAGAPEPGSVVLLGSGLCGFMLLVMRRRMHRSSH
jgi:hypothetical protein